MEAKNSPGKLLPKTKIENLVLECNKIAMQKLQNTDFSETIILLKKSEKILINELLKKETKRTYTILGITLNNIGCYYKKDNKPNVALKYLKKALEIECY